MAVQTTGYYGLGTSKRDFGMKTNMTLPVVSTPDLPSEESNKRRIKFGEKSSSKPQKSWKKRLSGIFQKNKKDEIEETPKREQPPPKPAKDTVAVEVSVEHREQPMDEGPIILTIKPTDATSDKKNRYVTLQSHKGDSLGIYLSGGGPPITVTHVEPGGVAEKARLKVGDTVLEVNGHDCRKNTDILRITELKMLIQQASLDSEDEDLNEEAWAYIKAKQGELDKSDISDDASNTTLPEEQAIPRVAAEIEVDKGNRPTVDEPPIAEKRAERPPKEKKNKKKASKELTSEQTAPTSEKKKKKKAPAVEKTQQRDSPGEQPADTIAVATNGKKKKKKVKKEPETEAAVSLSPSAVEGESKKKKRKSAAESVTKTEELEERDTVSPAPAETTQTKSKKKRKSKLVDSKFEDEAERPPATPQVEPDEKKVTKKKKKAAKTTTNPPPDTSEHMVDLLPPPVAPEEVPEKITIAVISKKGKKSKKVRDRSELYRVKDEDIDQETSKPVSTEKTSEPKIKKKKSHKKAKDTTLEKCDDLVFVSAHVDTRKPPSTEVKRKGKKSPLSRRKSEDHGQILGSDEVDFDPISTDHRSTSYTEDLNKEQKQFRNELRQTSKSQYDMAITPAASEERLVMKKSGVVMKKKGGVQRPTIFGQSSSPEPEEEEETIVQKEAVVPATITTRGKAKVPKTKDKSKKKKKEKRISTEMDFSDIPITPPSLGLAHGHDKLDLVNRSSSMSSRRPASLRKFPSTEEEVMGTKRVDLSNSKETPKRRSGVRSATLPASYMEEDKEDEDEEGVSGNLILSAHKKHVLGGYAKRSGQRRSSADIAKAAVSAIQQQQEEERQKERPTARSLFPEESTQPTRSEHDQFAAMANLSSKSTVFEQEPGSSPPINTQQARLLRDKSVEKPTKTLELIGMFSQTSSMDDQSHRRIKSVDKPVKTLGIASENGSQPAWVAIAQGRSKRSSAVLDDSPTKAQPQDLTAALSTQPEPQQTTPPPVSSLPPPQTTSATTTTTMTEKKKPSPKQVGSQAFLPKAGTVRERMAMFQQGK